MVTMSKISPTCAILFRKPQLNKKVELEIVRDGKPVTVLTEIKEQPVDYQTSQAVPRQIRRDIARTA